MDEEEGAAGAGLRGGEVKEILEDTSHSLVSPHDTRETQGKLLYDGTDLFM